MVNNNNNNNNIPWFWLWTSITWYSRGLVVSLYNHFLFPKWTSWSDEMPVTNQQQLWSFESKSPSRRTGAVHWSTKDEAKPTAALIFKMIAKTCFSVPSRKSKKLKKPYVDSIKKKFQDLNFMDSTYIWIICNVHLSFHTHLVKYRVLLCRPQQCDKLLKTWQMCFPPLLPSLCVLECMSMCMCGCAK